MKTAFRTVLLISSCILFLCTFAFPVYGCKSALGEFSVEESTGNVSNLVLGFVDGKNADRVHLRAEPSIKAKSLGLFFTGTEIVCVAETTSEWVRVVVGKQEGYMKSEYVHFKDMYGDVESKQPLGIVKDGLSCIIHSEPSVEAHPLGFIFEDDTVTILGETSSHWYYVMTQDQIGYVKADNLACEMIDDFGYKASGPSLYYENYLTTFPFEQSGREFWGIGTINAGDVGKVHLRESDNDLSQSFGEYYNGTKVVCVSDPSNLWTTVWIGNQIGSIPSRYIRMDNELLGNCFVVGRIAENSVVCASPYDEASPTFAGEEKVVSGQEIVIMGVTHNNRYFVDTGLGWGYISAEKVKLYSGLSGE